MIQGSPEWHEWRKSGIGASEMPAIMGLDPYGNTPYSTWLVKTGRAKGFEGNSFTEHGKETEAKARARYEFLKMEDMPDACATHPKYTFLLASLDGWNQKLKRVLELKCPKGKSTLEMAQKNEVIGHYVPQVQQQLLVAGADELDFFVYHEETDQDALVEVKPDLEYQAKIVLAGENFWFNHVLKDAPPPLLDADAKIVDDPQMLAIANELIALKDESGKQSKERSDYLKSLMLDQGGHTRVRCGRVLVSKTKTGARMTVKEIA